MSAVVARTNPFKLGALLLVGLLIASSWLIFPYFIQGQQVLRGVGDQSRNMVAGGVARYLTRSLILTEDLEITATYASSEYFQFVDRARVVGNLRPDRNFIFFISETIHRGELAGQIPEVTLRVGDEVYEPTLADGPPVAEHHRVSVYGFSKVDTDGNPIDIEGAGRMRLYVSNPYLGSPEPLTFVGIWEAPYTVPEELRSSSGITPIAVLALGAGLLSSVMTPCLLQLVVVFGSVIAGFSTVPGAPAGAGSLSQTLPVVRRKIMPIAIAFVLGFVVLYAVAGALIGSVGHRAQLLFAEYSRTVAVVSGLMVIALGLWIGLRGTPKLACRIPDRRAMEALSWRDAAGTIVASMGYALGCTACFGGAIVGTLLVYVGAIGSATIGASIMLVFAIGVAIPFLLAAYYISKVDGIVTFLAQHANKLNYAAMTLIIVFGLILVTDNFHAVSDMIYPYLGLR